MVKTFSGTELKDLACEVFDIALVAGQRIMDIYGQEDFAVKNKQDNSPLTQADLAADEVIFEGLSNIQSQIPVWSEERAKPESGWSGCFWLVDPLDGTKEFIKRNGEFSVNIALIANSEPVLGVIHAPALNESFVGISSVGAFQAKPDHVFDQLLDCSDSAIDDQVLRVVGSRSHRATKQTLWLERLQRPYLLEGVGSSLKFCRIAQGKAHVYVRHGATSQWDTAAGQAILECAGGSVLDSRGERLLYGLERNVINDEFIAAGPVAKAFRL